MSILGGLDAFASSVFQILSFLGIIHLHCGVR